MALHYADNMDAKVKEVLQRWYDMHIFIRFSIQIFIFN
jgi:hypothetical protein